MSKGGGTFLIKKSHTLRWLKFFSGLFATIGGAILLAIIKDKNSWGMWWYIIPSMFFVGGSFAVRFLPDFSYRKISSLKKTIFHSAMIFIFFLGVFLGTLPEISPNFTGDFLVGETKSMKTGYDRIIEFSEMNSIKRKNDIALKKDTPGYFAILRILHSVNPKIVSSPKTLKDSSFSNISTDRNPLDPGISLTLNREIFFQTEANQWKEVCTIRDLNYIIESNIGRYYFKIGSFCVLLVFFIEASVLIRAVILAKNK